MGDLTRDPWTLLPGPTDFLAEIHTPKYDTLTYSRSDGLAEDISFFDRRGQRNISVYPSVEKLAAQFWPGVPVLPILQPGATDGAPAQDQPAAPGTRRRQARAPG